MGRVVEAKKTNLKFKHDQYGLQKQITFGLGSVELAHLFNTPLFLAIAKASNTYSPFFFFTICLQKQS